MPRPGRPSVLHRLRRDEEGSILIEALAAAVVLIVIAMALLSSLDTAAKGSSRIKARAAATALAEQDLERLRSFAATKLANFHEENDRVSGGVTYHVASRADWITDDTSAPATCTSDDTLDQYLRITSTVTSAVVGTDMAPVTASSIVAPPVAAFGPDQGTLAVKVVDRDNAPVQNATVRATSPTGATISDATNSAGCAIFGYVDAGTYDVAVEKSGYVDPDGDAIATQTGVAVTAGQVNLTQQSYDVAGYVTFDFTAPNPVTPAQLNPSRGWNAFVGNTTSRVAPGGAAFTADSKAGIGPVAVYPFTGAYTFFSGDCTGNDPTKAPASDAAFFTNNPSMAQIVARTQPLAVTLKQPSFKAGVVSTNPVTITVKETTATPAGTTPGCGAAQKLGAATTWTTLAVGSTTYVTRTWSKNQSVPFVDTGLPFGTYTVCAFDPTAQKYAQATLDLKSLATPAAATLNTKTGTTGTGCP
jgi:Tfp pilus assembly protein PilV